MWILPQLKEKGKNKKQTEVNLWALGYLMEKVEKKAMAVRAEYGLALGGGEVS